MTERLTQISIHAPRVGCDQKDFQNLLDTVYISIHAPRVGCDFPSRYSVFSAKYFNPRTPRGVRHNQGNRTFLIFDISIHAPRVGCD